MDLYTEILMLNRSATTLSPRVLYCVGPPDSSRCGLHWTSDGGAVVSGTEASAADPSSSASCEAGRPCLCSTSCRCSIWRLSLEALQGTPHCRPHTFHKRRGLGWDVLIQSFHHRSLGIVKVRSFHLSIFPALYIFWVTNIFRPYNQMTAVYLRSQLHDEVFIL